MDERYRFSKRYSNFPPDQSLLTRNESQIVIPGRGIYVAGPSGTRGNNPRRNQHYNKWTNNKDRDYGRSVENSQHQQQRGRTNSGSSGTSTLPRNDSGMTGCKYYKCPGCTQTYYYFYNYKKNNILCGRVPRVLPCQHTLCDECINKFLKRTQIIHCPICSKIVDTKNQPIFDHNYYVVGQLTSHRTALPIDFSSLSLVSTEQNQQGCYKDGSFVAQSEEKCGLGGCQNLGIVSCLDCCKVYCNICDEVLHTNSTVKHLMSHKRNEIGKTSFELNKCADHLMLEELYCINCETNCCCYCVLEKHEGHTRTYLARLNEEEEEELLKGYSKAKGVIKKLQATQKKIKKPVVDKVSELEFEIAQSFIDVHARLQLLEKKLLEEAKDFRDINPNMVEVNRTMAANINTLTYLINCIDQRQEKKFNLKSLLKKLQDMDTLPYFLASDEGEEVAAKFVVDGRLEELEHYFKIKISSPESYKFLTADELLADQKKEENSSTETVIDLKLRPVKPDTQRRTKYEKPKKVVAIKQEPQEKKTKTNFVQQSVYITHINSLDSFYVQFKNEEAQWNQLENEIKKHIEKTHLGVDEVELGELYMAPCIGQRKKWGRVTAVEEVEVNGVVKYKCMFIDFGNSSVFAEGQLKYISESLANKKPFAVQCKQYNSSTNDWPADSHLKVAAILKDNNEVIMTTLNLSNNIYTVDLNVTTSMGGLTSIFDVLIFGYNALITKGSAPSYTTTSKIFDCSDAYRKGESHEVFIRYILDPWHIYVQKAAYMNSLTSLMNSMEQHYNNSVCDIQVPVEDSDVVIYYTSKDYGNWHRARIQDVFLNKKVVNVYLLDWGKELTVPWNNIRKLVETCKRMESLVISIKLADVGPKYESTWSKSDCAPAKKFLEKYCTTTKKMKLLVTSTGPLEILLFDTQKKFDININALLVDNNLAASTGSLSETTKWPNRSDDVKMDENEFLPIYKDYSEDDSDEDFEQGMRIQVEIVKMIDPHSIYVSLESNKSLGDRLHEELQIHYDQEVPAKRKWKVGDKIVVFDDKEHCYYRGVIKEYRNGEYSVYLIDKANDIVVGKKNLREINSYFDTGFPNMVFKCHLANIKPAGDSKKWSSLSIEWLAKVFDKYKDIYMEKISDDASKSSMPVSMWYTKIIRGAALVPSMYKYISIDKKISKAGLAFQENTKTPSMLDQSKNVDDVPKRESPHENMETTVNRSEPLVSPSKPVAEDNKSEPNVIKRLICPIKEWKPATPLAKKSFHAYVTCAETGGHLYIRDQDLHVHYKELEKIMKETFDVLPKPKSFELSVDQMVTILSDDYWYRGTVLSVIGKKTVKVMMIDFGSDHIVKKTDLHTRIMYPDLEMMVNKVKLYDVHSKTDRWLTSDIDALLDSIPNYVKIEIKSSSDIGIPLVEVYDVNGGSYNDKLVELCPNLYRSHSTKVKSVSDPISSNDISDTEICVNGTTTSEWIALVEEVDVNKKVVEYNYTPLSTVTVGNQFETNIVSVYDYRTVSIYLTDNIAKEEEFDALSNNLQMKSDELECETDLKVGMPCISLFQGDNQWYRAKIFRLDGLNFGHVTVFYVDYGNFDNVRLEHIKRVKQEWLDFPVRFYVARINYSLVKEQQENCVLLQHMQMLTGKTVFVEVVNKQPLSIHIHTEGGLYYDLFVTEGIVQIDNE